MTVDPIILWTAGAFLTGLWLGRLWLGSSLSRRLDRAARGEPVAWRGKVWAMHPIPPQPEFPGFARQKGKL